MSIKRLVPLNNLLLNTAPVSVRDGDMYLDTSTGRIQVYFNGSWKSLAYLVDIDSGLLNIVDGGLYNTAVFQSIIDGGFYNTVSFNDTLDAGIIL